MKTMQALFTFFEFVARIAPELIDLFYKEHPELDDRKIEGVVPEAEKMVEEARRRIGDK